MHENKKEIHINCFALILLFIYLLFIYFNKQQINSENIRLLDSVIKYTEGRNIPGLLLFIDFEKAFDARVAFYPENSPALRFVPLLLNWIERFYCNIESCILNNRWASNFLKLSRGVTQGCPLSPYLLFYLQKYLLTPFGKNRGLKAQK